MENDISKLPPPKKKVAAKVLYRNGWGSRIVGEWLGVSKDTVIRSRKIPTPENLRQFETDLEAVIKDMKLEARALLHKRIIELIPKEKRLDHLVRVGEFLEGKPAMQQNNQYNGYNFANLGADIAKSARERGLLE